MEKICHRALDFYQVFDESGDVRLCSWIRDNTIGNLLEDSFYDIYHSDKAEKIRNELMCGNYSGCKIDACPYIARNIIKEKECEIDRLPEWPLGLAIGFERVCNYRCTCCSVPYCIENMKLSGTELERRYSIIENRLREVMPHIKKISANGCGELFLSKHTLSLLNSWEPLAPKDEVEVGLETNGSLFDEKHWEQIANLGKYNLNVNITVMSFDERIYQYLSGSRYKIGQIEENLRFVKSLRDKGIINHLELATVVQEQNYRTIPELAERFVYEFGADYVRLRPYEPWGTDELDLAWYKDIRNPAHPLYKDYKGIMNSQIISHPKVHDESGGNDAEWSVRLSPFRVELLKNRIMLFLLQNAGEVVKNIKNTALDRTVLVYGGGSIGLLTADIFKNNGIEVKGIIDINPNICVGDNVLYSVEEGLNFRDAFVLVTPLIGSSKIIDRLTGMGYQNVIGLCDISFPCKMVEEMKIIS